MRSGRPTIRDVAKLAGVSTATVSYVINEAGRFTAETESKVRYAIQTLNYMPNSHARELASWRRQNLTHELSFVSTLD